MSEEINFPPEVNYSKDPVKAGSFILKCIEKAEGEANNPQPIGVIFKDKDNRTGFFIDEDNIESFERGLLSLFLKLDGYNI